MNQNELHCLEGVYHQYLRPLGIEDQMTMVLPVNLSSSPNVGIAQTPPDTIGIGVHRSQWNFSERDRIILDLLRSHVMQAYDNAKVFSQLQQDLARFNQALEQSNAIILDSSGQVNLMTRQAWSLITQYFQPQNTELPNLLQRWVNYQISRFYANDTIAFTALPLRVQQSEKRLVIRLIPDTVDQQFLLLLEEQQSRSLSLTDLELLGLTRREAEVLFWVTKDKTNSEIAALLGCSSSTVKTHLEHIYEKFGVQSRMAAVLYALKHLGMLNQ